MPKTPVTCQRKLSLPEWMNVDIVVTYKFSIFDMSSCRDVELQVSVLSQQKIIHVYNSIPYK